MKNKSGEKYSNFRHAKIIEVLKVEVTEGEGIVDDPIHRVAYILDKQGKVLAKIGETEDRLLAGNDEMIIIN